MGTPATDIAADEAEIGMIPQMMMVGTMRTTEKIFRVISQVFQRISVIELEEG